MPDVGVLTSELAAAASRLGPTLESMEPVDVVRAVQRAAGGIDDVDRQLRGTAGLRALLGAGTAGAVDELDGLAGELEARLEELE